MGKPLLPTDEGIFYKIITSINCIKNQHPNRVIADLLLAEIDVLVQYWNDYFIKNNNTTLSSFDGFSVFTKVDIKILKEALDIFYLIFNDSPDFELAKKIESVHQELELLFAPFGEYFDESPEEINQIAYLVYACFSHKKALFINLNQEKLNFYLQSAQQKSKALADKKDKQ